MAILDGVVSAGNKASAIREHARGILIPEDEANLRQIGEDVRRQFGQWMSPAEQEEVFVRLVATIEGEMNSVKLVGVDLAGNEYRDLMKLKSKGIDFFDDLLELKDESEGADKATEEKFEAEARSLLGETRFAAFQRAQDDRFQQAYQVAKEFSLPIEAAVKVFELRKATEEEVNRIRADQTLAKEQRREALKGIGDQTQQAITSVLGSQAMQAYLNRDGHWLNNLDGRPNARELTK